MRIGVILSSQSQGTGCQARHVSIGNRKLILLLLVLWLQGCDRIVDWVAAPLLLPQEGVRPATFTTVTLHRVKMVTRDGSTLLADVHRAVGIEKVPTILVRIPQTRTLINQLRADAIGRYWASRGYAVVIQGTRGRYGSGGTFYPLIHERQDGIDTLQWLAQQEWYDGRLAMWGGSSFGHTQWAVADQINPGPSALFIHIVSTDFRRMFYQGNAFALESALYWTIRSRGEEDREVSSQQLDEGERTLPLSQADDRAIGDTEFYNDWLKNQNNSAYWELIDGVDRAGTVQSPVLLLGGWYDPFLPGQLADFMRIRATAKPAVSSKTHLVIGPWAHADSVKVPGMKEEVPYRRSTLALSLPWFDTHLGMGMTSL
jgi:putative CocE/NonD family hydrolase